MICKIHVFVLAGHRERSHNKTVNQAVLKSCICIYICGCVCVSVCACVETEFVISKHFTFNSIVSVYICGQASVKTSMFYHKLPA